LLLLHTPPDVASARVIELPTRTDDGPVIGARELTVTTAVALSVPQALVYEYEIVAVPVDTPDTIPDVPTVAIDVLLLLHVPPDSVLLNVIVAPTLRVDAPETVPAFGSSMTLNAAVFEEDMLLLHPDAADIELIVTVVAPALVSDPEGIENVPLPEPMVNVAVLAPVVLLPPRL
jgi:hypothetical protein